MRRGALAVAVGCGILTALVAFGIGIGVGASEQAVQDPANISPRLPVPSRDADLPSEAPAGAARSALSPTDSLAGRAVATVLPAGEQVKAVQAIRLGRTSYDLVDARRADGSGWEVNLWRSFDESELAAAGVAPVPTAGGRFWPAADDQQMQSLYFQSISGVAVRVAYYSASSGDRISQLALLSVASRLVDTLTALNGGRPPTPTSLTAEARP